MSYWKKVVRHCEEEYGTHIDWEDEELRICPVCEFEW